MHWPIRLTTPNSSLIASLTFAQIRHKSRWLCPIYTSKTAPSRRAIAILSILASSLDPADPTSQTACRSDQPFFHNTLDRRTDRCDRRQTCALSTAATRLIIPGQFQTRCNTASVSIYKSAVPVHLMDAESDRWSLTLRPSQPTWIVSPPLGCYHPPIRPKWIHHNDSMNVYMPTRNFVVAIITDCCNRTLQNCKQT